MKAGIGLILRSEQELYLERLLPPRDAILTEMEAEAEREDVPISDPEVGRLLEVLARASGARTIVEVGTAIGYGTLCLARGAPEARVLSIDIDPARLARARGYLSRAGVMDRVELIEGPALQVLQNLSLAGPIDLAYVDAVKIEYRRYLDFLLPRLRVGGMLVFDNLLWKGHVAEPTEEDDASADALRAFNGYLMIHPQLRASLLPLGDGVGLATKTKPLMTEMGGPY
jgi:predicted O-methyltransferase YrrM